MTTKTEPQRVVHWFYPSTVIPCGQNIDDLPNHTDEVAPHGLRSEVTCEPCKAQLEEDKKICARCRTGNESAHACDPGNKK